MRALIDSIAAQLEDLGEDARTRLASLAHLGELADTRETEPHWRWIPSRADIASVVDPASGEPAAGRAERALLDPDGWFAAALERFTAGKEAPPRSPTPGAGSMPDLHGLRIASTAEDTLLLRSGSLPMPCPRCGQTCWAESRTPLDATKETLGYACCELFFLLRPIREWSFERALYRPARGAVTHAAHRHFARRHLESSLVALIRVVARGVLAPSRSAPAFGGAHSGLDVVFGRRESNPGHLIFEDLAAIAQLARVFRGVRPTPTLTVHVTPEAQWYAPLVQGIAWPGSLHVRFWNDSTEELALWLSAQGRSPWSATVRPCWPHTLGPCDDLRALVAGIRRFAGTRRGAHGAARKAARIVIPLRAGSRVWEPLAENLGHLLSHLGQRRFECEFTVHAVGSKPGDALDAVRSLARRRDDVRLLFDPTLLETLQTYRDADLCVGPIGSAFWWAGLFATPSVTLHPPHDPEGVELGDWILPPCDGKPPHFLSIDRAQRFVALEDDSTRGRAPYGPIRVDVEAVCAASEHLLEESEALERAARSPERFDQDRPAAYGSRP